MSSACLAINGFGRIGRLTLRALFESGRTDLRVVAINGTKDPETLAHLLRYDSVHGRFAAEVAVKKNALVINGAEIALTAEREIKNLNWHAAGAELVLECSGAFRTRETLTPHLTQGAKRVVLSAPAKSADEVDRTVVWGINDQTLDRRRSTHLGGFLYDQLSGSAGGGAGRNLRFAARVYDNSPCLYR